MDDPLKQAGFLTVGHTSPRTLGARCRSLSPTTSETAIGNLQSLLEPRSHLTKGCSNGLGSSRQ
jgi:hypothetical protein